MLKSRLLLLPVALTIVLALACGGDDNDSNVITGGTGGSGSAVSQELDLTRAANQLLAVESFRFDIRAAFDIEAGPDASEEAREGVEFLSALLGDVQAEGSFVGPDSVQVDAHLFGQDVKVVQIGDEAWIDDGTGWHVLEPDDTMGFAESFSPNDLIQEYLPEEILQDAETSEEEVNGVDTTRYSFDKDALVALSEELGEESGDLGEIENLSLDMWLTDEGVPVKMTIFADGEAEGIRMDIEIEFNLTDLNDEGIAIERPM